MALSQCLFLPKQRAAVEAFGPKTFGELNEGGGNTGLLQWLGLEGALLHDSCTVNKYALEIPVAYFGESQDMPIDKP